MVVVAIPVAMGSYLSSIVGGLVSDVVVLRVLALDVGVLSSFVDRVVSLGLRRLLCVLPLMSVFLALVSGPSGAVGAWLPCRHSHSHIRFVLVIFLGSGVPFGVSVFRSSVLGIPFGVSASQSSVLEVPFGVSASQSSVLEVPFGVSASQSSVLGVPFALGSILRSIHTVDVSRRIPFHICLDGNIQVLCRILLLPRLSRLVVVLRCLHFWSPRSPFLWCGSSFSCSAVYVFVGIVSSWSVNIAFPRVVLVHM